MEQNWEEGVAFVRGINIYKNVRVTQRKMLELCKKVENDDLQILKIVRTDNVIFKKRGMHYATVGSKLENVLSSHFGKPIYVTTRSMKTIRYLKWK
ncbi:MAG: DUF1697 domain-containing protein [Candidatus Hadarchaeota archaeon]|nr:DUF1697 domain-containing protein [Candidatus Hadarchaeota archaeon]